MVNGTDLVLAITGASGAPYAVRLLEVLLRADRRIHLVISPAGREVLEQELEVRLQEDVNSLLEWLGNKAPPHGKNQVRAYGYRDFRAGIASGSFPTAGMIVCPCSMGTVAAIAHGFSENLIHRAADVHLKEKRPLVLVPRETPLSLVHLRNLTACAEAGATVLPAMPAYYLRPRTIGDMIDFVVSRICDQVGVAHRLLSRWGADSPEQAPRSADQESGGGA